MNQQPPSTTPQDPANPKSFTRLWESIKSEWLDFLTEVCRPIPVVLLVFTAILGTVQTRLATSSQTDSADGGAGSVSALTILVISIASSIYGAIVYDRWKQVQEQNKLSLKGQSALRGLQMLLATTRNQKKKIQEYKETIVNSSELDKKDVEFMFRELEQSSSYLTTFVLGSLGEWGDILPNSVYTIREKVDAFAELDQEISDSKEKLKLKEVELTNVQSTSENDKKAKSALEDEVKDLRKKVSDLEQQEKRDAAQLFRFVPSISHGSVARNTRYEWMAPTGSYKGKVEAAILRSKSVPPSAGAPTPEVFTADSDSFDN